MLTKQRNLVKASQHVAVDEAARFLSLL